MLSWYLPNPVVLQGVDSLLQDVERLRTKQLIDLCHDHLPLSIALTVSTRAAVNTGLDASHTLHI